MNSLVNHIKTPIQILTPVAIIIMAIISVLVYGASVGSLLIMTAFILFSVQLPGLLIIRAVGIDKSHISTSIALGLFSGWCLNLVIYFISDLLHTAILLLTICPVLSLYYIYTVIRDRSGVLVGSNFSIRRLSPAFCLFFILILLYSIVNTQYLYISPDISDFTYLNPDKAYHMGLINSLSHDYPLQSPWIQGIMITYHIFSEMLFSIPVKLFGIRADIVTQSFGPFITAYCFGLSLYSFYREFSGRPERAGIYSLLTILANIYPTRRASTSLAFTFILINDNSSGYGISATLMTLVVLRKWYEKFSASDKNHWPLLVMSTTFIMLTTGIKGPMGAVAVAGLWGTVLLGIILKKVPARTLFPLMLFTAGFILIYLTILGSRGQTNAAGNSVVEFATITDIAFWKKPLREFMKRVGIPQSIRLIIILVTFVVFFFTVFFIPFCIGYLRELVLVLSRRKEFDLTRILVYAECAVGFIALFLLNYSGHSQVYFGLVTAFLGPIVSFWFIEDLEQSEASSKLSRYTLRGVVCIMAVTLLFTSIGLASYYGRHIRDAVNNSDPHRTYNEYMSISNEEVDAMEWLAENTPEDSLLATDRYYSVPPEEYSYQNRWDNRFFLYAVYSNRFTYISGSGYNLKAADWPIRMEMIETNSQLYDINNENRGDLARELDVDYVVVSKRFTDIPDLSNDDYELCYSNDDVDIYKINEAS